MAIGEMISFSSLSREAAEVAERVREGVVLVRSGRRGHGSGVVWSEDGLVVTNDHVVGSDRADVTLHDGRRLPASVLKRDHRRDLAVLRVDASSLPAVPVGDSRALRPGQVILAVGNPLGVQGAVSLGIISGTVGEVWIGGRKLPEMVRADIDLYPGNSGGPLVDAQGRVIGINTMVTGPGIALAVPSHVVWLVLQNASAPRPFVGLTVTEVRLPMWRGARPPVVNRGLLVQSVVNGGPAARAGVTPGDLIVGLDGDALGPVEDIAERVEQLPREHAISLALMRAGRLLEVKVQPEWRN